MRPYLRKHTKRKGQLEHQSWSFLLFQTTRMGGRVAIDLGLLSFLPASAFSASSGYHLPAPGSLIPLCPYPFLSILLGCLHLTSFTFFTNDFYPVFHLASGCWTCLPRN